MIQSRNWTAIERLPKRAGVVEMTSTGYVIDGQHVRTVPMRPKEPEQPRRSWLARIWGQ